MISTQCRRNHIVWEYRTTLMKCKLFLFCNFLLRLYTLRLTIILLLLLPFALAATQAVKAEFVFVTMANFIFLFGLQSVETC